MDLFTCMCFTIVLVIIVDFLLKPKTKFPTPKRIPILGNLFYLKNKAYVTITEWSKTYGNLINIDLFGVKHYIVVSGYEGIHEVLMTKGIETSGRLSTFRLDIIMHGEKDFIFDDMTPQWKMLRKMIASYLKQNSLECIKKREARILDICDDTIQAIRKERCSNNSEIDPYEYLYLAIVNSMAFLISGNKYDGVSDPAFQKWINLEHMSMKHVTLTRGVEIDLFPWLRFFGISSYKALSVVRGIKNDLFQTLKDEYETLKGENTTKAGLAFALFAGKEDPDSLLHGMLTDGIIENIVYDLIIAGTATSTGSIYTFMVVMAAYPDVQEKIWKEIQAQSNKNKSKDKFQISLSDRENMPYTKAAILELQRFGSFVPLNLLHKTLEDVTILGEHIPKNTALMTNLWGLHHDEKYWDQPWDFIPERFLKDTGELVESDHFNLKHLLAFGAGPRVCIGKELGLARVFLLATNMLLNFKIEKCDQEEVVIDPRSFESKLATNAPRQKLKFHERQKAM